MRFYDIVQDNPPLNDEEVEEFRRLTSSWEALNRKLKQHNDPMKLVRLLHYMIETRPAANVLIQRIVQRFNKVNSISMEDLYE